MIGSFRLQRRVDLDANATTDVSRRVRRVMARVLRRHHGNPSGAYADARSAAAILEEARESVAAAIGADAEEVQFTGCATEANNQVLQYLAGLPETQRGGRILSTPIEHPSIMHTLEHLGAQGTKVEMVPVDAFGRVDMSELEERLAGGASLLCCMLANNEIGTIQNVREVAAMARRHDVPVLCDCVQALGKIPVDVHALDVDYATFSAHKLHGPKGIGALYVRRGAEVGPLLHGGRQEGAMRAGTEAVHDIAGFGEACRAVPALLAQKDAMTARRDGLLAELRGIRPDLVLNSHSDDCLPNTLSVRFPGQSNTQLMASLDMRGIAVSAGSACSTSENVPSHVLTAIGLSEEEARETIRISLSHRTSHRDLRYLSRTLRDHFSGRLPTIPLVPPSRVDEAYLRSDDHYLLDVRFEVERKLARSLPGSHLASVISFARYVHAIPKDKRILVVCSTGVDATPIAYALHKRGYRNVAILLGGLVAWKLQHSELDRRLAGMPVSRIERR